MHAIRILNMTVDIHKSFVDLYYTILQLRGLVGEKSKFSDVSGWVSSKIIISKFRWKSSTLFSDTNEKVTYITCTMERNMRIDSDYVHVRTRSQIIFYRT